MNFAHLHLIINHIPVVGIPLALLFLAYGLLKRNLQLQNFSLLVLVALAIMLIPVYLTGEPAEKVIEHLPDFAESFIANHEDSAIVSLVITLLMGLMALIALLTEKFNKNGHLLKLVVGGIGFFAVISLFYTASLGGKVRHTELRDESAVTQPHDKADTEKK